MLNNTDGYKVSHVTATEHSVVTAGDVELTAFRRFAEGSSDRLVFRADSGNWKAALEAIEQRDPNFSFTIIITINIVTVSLTGTARQIIEQGEAIEKAGIGLPLMKTLGDIPNLTVYGYGMYRIAETARRTGNAIKASTVLHDFGHRGT